MKLPVPAGMNSLPPRASGHSPTVCRWEQGRWRGRAWGDEPRREKKFRLVATRLLLELDEVRVRP
ncbi:hypothetical protein, partial [Hyalangium sp.]|uniref:hypothetical protein n=1 Tax=Hyalangium sp. TaxID=2028555 RepID=UPI002D5B664E